VRPKHRESKVQSSFAPTKRKLQTKVGGEVERALAGGQRGIDDKHLFDPPGYWARRGGTLKLAN
jgi:hypothetical protein